MKILLCSDYLSGTGYASFSCDTILSLDAAGIDVVPRSFKLATQTVEPPARIRELEKKSIDNITHVIQHTLPCYFSYRGGIQNIGLFHMETSNWLASGWAHSMNLMDQLLVSCPENEKAAKESNVTKPLSVIPRGLNASLYDKKLYKQLNLNIGTRYAFYHIGDYSTRKNTANLIKSYLEEFSKSDHCVLILKTYIEGMNPQQSLQAINEDIQKIKQSLRKSAVDNYPPIILLTDYLSNEAMMALHAMGDCFVTLERGVGYGLPMHDAIGFGNWVIANGWGGHTQFTIQGKTGWLVPYRWETVSGMTRCPFPNLYTCHEKWGDPDCEEAKAYMREAYNSKIKIDEHIRQEFLQEFSYASVGEKIKRVIL